MKKLILCFLVTAALLLTKTEIFAQQNDNADQKAQLKEMMRQRLKDSVGLSDAQVDSVIAIRQEMQPRVKEVMKDQTLSEDDKKSKMEAIRKEVYERYTKAGLTQEQVKKIRELDERLKGKMRNHTDQ